MNNNIVLPNNEKQKIDAFQYGFQQLIKITSFKLKFDYERLSSTFTYSPR